MEATQVETCFEKILAEIEKVVVGQTELVEALLVALFAEGNVLLEGGPGLGKTQLVNALARVLDCQFRRIQFTPDLSPMEITGVSVFDPEEREFRFTPGPLFTNLLLADEINRAPARTQAALLEAMQERQVTVDGTTYLLDRPFMTVATQNPLEQEGTYPLPESQLDRFLFKLPVDYPEPEQEAALLRRIVEGRDPRNLNSCGVQPVLHADDVLNIRLAASSVIVEDAIIEYITRLVSESRVWPSVEVGASPRAGVHLLVAGRARAACRGRDFVTPDDIKTLVPAVFRHRLRLQTDAIIDGLPVDDVIEELLYAVEAPRG